MRIDQIILYNVAGTDFHWEELNFSNVKKKTKHKT